MNVQKHGRTGQKLVAWTVITAAIVGIAVAAPPETSTSGDKAASADSSPPNSGTRLVIRQGSAEPASASKEPKVLNVPGQTKPIPHDPSATRSAAVAPRASTTVEAEVSSASEVETSVAENSADEAWTHWEGGRPVWQGARVNGHKNGRWLRWLYDGEGPMFDEKAAGFERPFIMETTFKQGSLEGTCTVVDKRKRTVCTLTLKAGQLEGPATWFYANGKPRSETTYVDGRLNGRLREFDDTGRVDTDEEYERGRRLGHHVDKFANDRTMVEGNFYYAGDVMRSTFDWAAASLTTALDTTLDKDHRAGLWTWFHPNGQKQLEGTYQDNEPHGKFVWYYTNAQKQAEGQYVAGKRDGVWATWHTNGVKESEGRYLGGEPAGGWLTWDTSGQKQAPTSQTAKGPSGAMLR